MPIQLLFAGLGAGIAFLSLGKAMRDHSISKSANKINCSADEILNEVKFRIDKSRITTADSIFSLGNKKIAITHTLVSPFIQTFEKLQNINQEDISDIDPSIFTYFKQLNIISSVIADDKDAKNISNATITFGAFGTPIISDQFVSAETIMDYLSDTASKNTTVSFFSGTKLAENSLNKISSGILPKNILSLLDFIIYNKASKNKDRAYKKLLSANNLADESKTVLKLCLDIKQKANMHERLLIKLDTILSFSAYNLENLIRLYGTDYSEYTQDQKQIVLDALYTTTAIKSVLDMPVITEDGKLPSEDKEAINFILNIIESHPIDKDIDTETI